MKRIIKGLKEREAKRRKEVRARAKRIGTMARKNRARRQEEIGEVQSMATKNRKRRTKELEDRQEKRAKKAEAGNKRFRAKQKRMDKQVRERARANRRPSSTRYGRRQKVMDAIGMGVGGGALGLSGHAVNLLGEDVLQGKIDKKTREGMKKAVGKVKRNIRMRRYTQKKGETYQEFRKRVRAEDRKREQKIKRQKKTESSSKAGFTRKILKKRRGY